MILLLLLGLVLLGVAVALLARAAALPRLRVDEQLRQIDTYGFGAATAEGILCLTAIETAVAAAEALDPAIRSRLADVRSLGEWVPEPGRPRQAWRQPALVG